MDRVSGWYKRKTQGILFALGLCVAVIANVDTLAIAQFLYADKPTREALVAEASPEPSSNDTRAVIAQIQQLSLPIGWNARPAGSKSLWTSVLAPAFGWLTTALAISLGAPFWFDVLKRVMEIRATVKPRDKPIEVATPPAQGALPVAVAGPPLSDESLFRPNEWRAGPPREGVL